VKKLIVTGDDFGVSLSVNKAIEEAHRQGILTTASLMVGAGAAADAVERARRLPSLRVGLHLVLVDGSPVSPIGTIPDLLDSKGKFPADLVKTGIRFFFSRRMRRQLEEETHAQFQAFHKTRLPLDHANTHHHLHLHPMVLGILLKVGKEYGVKAVRLPYEPPIPSWRASRKGLIQRLAAWFFLCPWIAQVRKGIAEEGLYSNDFIFGMKESGHMVLDLVLRIIKVLPEGVTEIYFHPTCSQFERGKDHGSRKEYEALTSPEVREALHASGTQLISFSDLWGGT
jgi:hopanoid biosynthesis associated protein HpnK